MAARIGVGIAGSGFVARFHVQSWRGVIVARTADRSVLGCMNDMAVLCEHAIATSRDLRQADLARQSVKSSARTFSPHMTRPVSVKP